MTRLVLRLALFLFLFGVFLGTNHFVNRWLFSNVGGKLDGVSVLVVGDSHLLAAVDPEYLPGGENICQNAEPYIVTFHKLRYFLARNPGIRTVVLGFSYHNLSAFNDLKFVGGERAKAQFDRVYALMGPGDFAPLRFDRRKYYRSVVRHTLLYPILDHSRKFTGAFKATEFGLDQADVAAIVTHHYYLDGHNHGVSQVATAYLDSIVTLVERSGRELVLLSPPLHAEYIEGVPENFVSHFEETMARCESRGASVLDYSRVPWEGKYFKDYNHVNKEGAARLTRLLQEWLAKEH